MATDYSISNLRTKLGTLARPNNFKVSLSLASTGVSGADVDIMPGISSIKDTFEFRCEKAELPGRTDRKSVV